ncbi:MAG: sigma-70 family RNA polymerase sigma factor [Deltaproteobacteria bacterium]|nr:sigma-70 family RNA polymerase sigma factor [Deltaproteobacteria bacterium]
MEPEGAGGERDEVLLAHAAAAGDAEARRTLVLRVIDRVRNVARWITRNEADADDAAQAALIDVLRCAGDFRGDGSLASWAGRIAARTATALAERRRRDARESGPASELTAAAQGAPGGSGSTPLLRARLARCLDRLPDERRVTVALRLILGCTLDEIARETGVPVNTAKDRLRVGKQELRQAILADPILADAWGKVIS